MCGIFGYVNTKNASRIVLDGLKSLEYRGYDSWGIATLDNSQIKLVKNVGQLKDVKESILPEGAIALGHTRWATHGGVTTENAHPHLDCEGSLAVIHNGIVENFDKIKAALTGTHKFISQTDSEIVVHLVEELAKKNKTEEAIRLAFLMLKGSNAFVFLTSEGKLIAIKNGSPLVIGLGQKGNLIASDASSLVDHAKKAIFLEDGQMAEISQKSIVIKEVTSGRALKPKVTNIDWHIEKSALGKYEHFMLKEIEEQPAALRKILGNKDAIYHLAKIIKEAKGVFFVGCGTASYVSLAANYLFSKIANLHVNFVVGSEFKYLQTFINKKSLVIAVSQSGETIDVVESVKKAKGMGASIAAITNVYGSTIYRFAAFPLLIGAGVEKAVCATKSFTNMVGCLLYINYILAGHDKEGENLILAISKSLEKIISTDSQKKIHEIARQLKDKHHVYIIGRGLSYPAVLEAALKLKEVAYIHSEGFAGGELKHGALALIEKDTPCIVFAPNDETYDEIISNAIEIKARKGTIIGVSHKNNAVFDHFLPIDDVKEGSFIPSVVIVQLLAYYVACEKGIDPDKPRNLAKSVTVK